MTSEQRWVLACKTTIELINRVNSGADLATELAEALVKFPSFASSMQIESKVAAEYPNKAGYISDVNISSPHPLTQLYLYIEMRRVNECGMLEPTESDLSYVSGRHVWVEAHTEPEAYRAGEMTCAASPLSGHSSGRLLGDYLVLMADSVTPANRSIERQPDEPLT